MEAMNQAHAQSDIAEPEHSNAETQIAHHRPPFVTVCYQFISMFTLFKFQDLWFSLNCVFKNISGTDDCGDGR